jgi:uncharacterized membrane protein YdcZ (DUF606 family)
VTEDETRDPIPRARLLSSLSFALLLFPVLVGLITLVMLPVYLRSGQNVAEPIAKAIVRVAGMALVIAFIVITNNPRRGLAAWNAATIVVVLAHLLTPLVFHGFGAFFFWIHPFFLAPALAAILSAVSLCLMPKHARQTRRPNLQA